MRRTEKRVVHGFIIAALLFIAGALACSRNHTDIISGSGNLEATEVLVSSKATGQILKLFVEEGSEITEGQVIAVVDTEKTFLQKQQLLAGLDELKLNIQNAQRAVTLANDNLANMQKKFERVKSLLTDNSATQQQYDDMETAYKAAETNSQNAKTSLQALRAKEQQVQVQLALMESLLRDAHIVSPISGTVLEKYVEQGENVRLGSPVVNLANLQSMWIKIYLSEAELGKVKLGSNADLSISAFPERSFPGKITWIAAKAEFTPKNVQTKEARADLVYGVKVMVENPEGVLKIGMPADVVVR